MTAQPIAVRVSRRYAAPAERVFDAWLDVGQAARFLFATPSGQMVRAEIDARAGGGFNFTERREGQDVEHEGQYLEIDRPRRLLFRFRLPAESRDFTRVTVEIAPCDDGCELTLTHELHPQWAEFDEKMRAGWSRILDGLAAVLDARTGGG